MDSLTQIVLGAACGEAALGKKIGNKALLFGAIGGTIPDLDVFVGSWIHGNEIDAMLFHRGFMHSILFSVLASVLLAWVSFRLYNSNKRKGTTTQKEWFWLWFLSLVTHPILDCFTPYGTQLFAPFSSYRVAFNTIAVADPFYTIPFLVCLIVLMFFSRTASKRRFWLKLGLGISSVYLLFAIVNKIYVDSVFRKSIGEQGFNYNRYITQPSIFNNILWYAVAETDSSYIMADYSLFDTKSQFSAFKTVPKIRDLNPDIHQDIKNLVWFSNGFYNVEQLNETNYLYNDLRYPIIENEDMERESVFSFILFKDGERLNMKPAKPKFDGMGAFVEKLWIRIKGV